MSHKSYKNKTKQYNNKSQWTIVVSLTLYSGIYRMLLCRDHQRDIVWVRFNRC